MSSDNKTSQPDRSERRKPYAMLGAGPLTAAIWKTGDVESGWRYRFNLYRMSTSSGRVSQRFAAADVKHLARLTELLAFTLADDGCLPRSLRRELHGLAQCLSEAIERCSHITQPNASTDMTSQSAPPTNNRSSQQ